jgi:hypothetical protein
MVYSKNERHFDLWTRSSKLCVLESVLVLFSQHGNPFLYLFFSHLLKYIQPQFYTTFTQTFLVGLISFSFFSALFSDAVNFWDNNALVKDEWTNGWAWSISGMILAGKNISIQRKDCPSASFSTTEHTWTAWI